MGHPAPRARRNPRPKHRLVSEHQHCGSLTCVRCGATVLEERIASLSREYVEGDMEADEFERRLDWLIARSRTHAGRVAGVPTPNDVRRSYYT